MKLFDSHILDNKNNCIINDFIFYPDIYWWPRYAISLSFIDPERQVESGSVYKVILV